MCVCVCVCMFFDVLEHVVCASNDPILSLSTVSAFHLRCPSHCPAQSVCPTVPAAHVRLVDISINISITALWVRSYVRGCTAQGKGAGVTLRGNVTLIYDLHVCVCVRACTCVRVFCSVLHSFFIAAQPRFASSRSLLAPLFFFLFTFQLSLASLAVLSQFIFSSALSLFHSMHTASLSRMHSRHSRSLSLSLLSPTALRSCSHFLFQLLLLLPRRG